MGHDVLKKFDRYFLLDCIAQGGMAEIFRARLASPDGAGRLLVIKRIQASYGKNPEFQKMFKSEIKVMMGFNHPNIVHFYDYGEFKSQPFIAMEFCDGRNLRQYIHRLAEQKKTFPIEVACYIFEQVANGLHFAHVFKDKITGEPLQLVHRDVSPQNIVVTYDGGVKIIDFGIAKAKTNSEQTRVGIIKGKPPYLSPEQIIGQVLDGRSDVFSLGATFWESLTGRKLFAAKKGENEFAVLKLIESADSYVQPPSTVNPAIPKELDEIVMKSLTKDREKRYQSCDDFARALRQFLNQKYPGFVPGDISHLAKQLFKDEIVEDRKNLARLSAEAEKLLNDDFTIMTQAGKRSIEAGKNQPAIQGMDADAIDTTGIKIDRPVGGTPSSRGAVGAPGAGASPGSFGQGFSRTGVPSGTSSVSGMRSGSALRTGAGSGSKFLRLAAAGVAAAAALGFLFWDQISDLTSGAGGNTGSQPAQATAQSTTPVTLPEGQSGKTILLQFDIRPLFSGTTITLNGKAVDAADPKAIVPMDESLELRVTNQNFKTFERQFVVYSKDYAGVTQKREEVNLEPIRFGYLTLSTEPATSLAYIRPWDDEARGVASDDRPWIASPPLVRVRLPVGSYLIKLESKVLEMSKELVIKVEEGQIVTHDSVRLEVKANAKPNP